MYILYKCYVYIIISTIYVHIQSRLFYSSWVGVVKIQNCHPVKSTHSANWCSLACPRAGAGAESNDGVVAGVAVGLAEREGERGAGRDANPLVVAEEVGVLAGSDKSELSLQPAKRKNVSVHFGKVLDNMSHLREA